MKKKYYGYVIAVTIFLAVISYFVDKSENAGEEITALIKGEPGSGTKEVALELSVPELDKTTTYELLLEEREYTAQERDALFEAAKQEIDQCFPGEGESMEHITGSVHLPQTLQEGQVQVEWTFEKDGVIEPDGSIREENVAQTGTFMTVTAQLSYLAYECLYQFPICIYPSEKKGFPAVAQKLEQYMNEAQKQQAAQRELKLPESLLGYQLKWSKEQPHTPVRILFLGAFVLLLLPWYEKEQEDKKRQLRKQQIVLEYPAMLSEFMLLLGSGMTIRMVWKKLAETYERKKQTEQRQSELYEEICHVWRSIEEGGGEVKAYEGFAERCGLPCCKRFSMLLIQHLEKGTKGLEKELEQEAAQAMEERKNMAKRQGEEAGTKLVFPMLLMLGVVVAVMLIPACMAMDG